MKQSLLLSLARTGWQLNLTVISALVLFFAISVGTLLGWEEDRIRLNLD